MCLSVCVGSEIFVNILYPGKCSSNWTLYPLQSSEYGAVYFFSVKFHKKKLSHIRIILINALLAFVSQCCHPPFSFYWYFANFFFYLNHTNTNEFELQIALFLVHLWKNPFSDFGKTTWICVTLPSLLLCIFLVSLSLLVHASSVAMGLTGFVLVMHSVFPKVSSLFIAAAHQACVQEYKQYFLLCIFNSAYYFMQIFQLP